MRYLCNVFIYKNVVKIKKNVKNVKNVTRIKNVKTFFYIYAYFWRFLAAAISATSLHPRAAPKASREVRCRKILEFWN